MVLILGACSTLFGAQLTVRWDDNSSTEVGFKVERSTNGSTFTILAIVGLNTTSYVDSSVAAATTYWYRVKAYDLKTNSAYSNVATATVPAATTTTTPTSSTSTTSTAWTASSTFFTSALDTTKGSSGTSTTPALLPARLGSLTARAVGGLSTAQTMRLGFTVTGGTKSALVRAVGPGLDSFTSSAVMPDPRLTVYSGSNVIVANDNWGGSSAVSTISNYVGAFPLSTTSDDAAAYRAFGNGSYQMNVVGDVSGLVQSELYDADTSAVPNGKFSKASVRAHVGTGSGILTAGFTIEGNTRVRLLLRAVGPSLSGVSNRLADPVLSLYKGTTLVSKNDNWAGNSLLASAFTRVGATALSSTSKDSALLVTLEPGVYSASITGVSSTVGVAQLELYEESTAATVVRVNAGGGSLSSSTGKAWSSDTGFNTGVIYAGAATVTGTSDPSVFQTERYQLASGSPLVYTIPVTNGTYLVRLVMAETHTSSQGIGKRVFDVDIQSARAFENVDIYAHAGGGNKALVLQKTTAVTNGQLKIGFIAQVQNPKINAIEIIAVP